MIRLACIQRLARRALRFAALILLMLPYASGARAESVASPLAVVGITSAQIARISVVNTQDRASSVPAGPILVELSFSDSSGNPVLDRKREPVVKTVTLDPGHGDSLVLPGAWVAGPGARVGIVPCFRVIEGGEGARAVPTLELLSARGGVTTLLHPGLARGFDPQPEPPAGSGEIEFGLAALAAGHTARTWVLNARDPASGDPHEAMTLEVLFHDAAGQVLLNRAGQEVRKTLTLEPNQAAFLDIIGGEIAAPGAPLGIVPCVRELRGGSGALVVPALEIFRDQSQQTVLYGNFAEGLTGMSAPR